MSSGEHGPRPGHPVAQRFRRRFEALLGALDERTGFRSAWRFIADERIPGGARWAYVYGSILATLLLAQAASGLLLAFDYAPSTDSAWESVARLSDPEISTFGPVVRALHHHGASFLVVALVLHVLQVAWFGAYRRPREANWWTGLGLGLLILAAAFTGYLLPWDQTAFYATRVGLNIMRSVPLIGPLQADLLQGDQVLGNLTLTRFYALHAILLPALIGGLLVVHLGIFRRHGVTPPAGIDDEELGRRSEPFWPHQAARDALAGLGVIALLVLVSWLLPAELGAKADPSAGFDARPEWYFYWLFQLLHWFEPPIELVGTLLIPGALLAFLALLPFLDRSPERGWRARLLPLGGLVGALAVILGLTLQVVLAERQREGDAAPDAAAAAPPAPAGAASRQALEAAMLYGLHCTECHGFAGEPIDEDAQDFRTEDFARMAAADFQALVDAVMLGGEMMPAFDEDLSEEQARLILREVVLRFGDRAASD